MANKITFNIFQLYKLRLIAANIYHLTEVQSVPFREDNLLTDQVLSEILLPYSEVNYHHGQISLPYTLRQNLNANDLLRGMTLPAQKN